MSRTKRYIVVSILFGLAYLFITKVPYGDQVKLKKSLTSIPDTVGEWAGHKVLKQKSDFPSHADQYLYREYVNTKGQSLFLDVSYWGKFKQGADTFSGNHISPGILWDTVSEKDIIVEFQGEKYSVKETVYAKGNNYISLIYWYHTNHGITTRRFAERLANGIDAMLNRRTNVALIRIISTPYLDNMPIEVASSQVDFVKRIFPLLRDAFPFEQEGPKLHS